MVTTEEGKTVPKTTNKKPELGGLYTAGFILGIIGIVFAFIPVTYWLAYILGALALIFGIIGLVNKEKGYKPITATILGGVTIVLGIIMNIIVVTVINAAFTAVSDGAIETINAIGDIASEATQNSGDSSDNSSAISSFLDNYESDAIGKTLEVTIEGYQDIDDFWSDKGLVVTMKNISDKTQSFTVNIEALDANGNRIDESFVSAEDLAPGQSKTDNAFTLSSLDEEILENATFRIYRATSY